MKVADIQICVRHQFDLEYQILGIPIYEFALMGFAICLTNTSSKRHCVFLMGSFTSRESLVFMKQGSRKASFLKDFFSSKLELTPSAASVSRNLKRLNSNM